MCVCVYVRVCVTSSLLFSVLDPSVLDPSKVMAKKSSSQSVGPDHGVLGPKTDIFFERAKVSVSDCERDITAGNRAGVHTGVGLFDPNMILLGWRYCTSLKCAVGFRLSEGRLNTFCNCYVSVSYKVMCGHATWVCHVISAPLPSPPLSSPLPSPPLSFPLLPSPPPPAECSSCPAADWPPHWSQWPSLPHQPRLGLQQDGHWRTAPGVH